MFHGLQVILIKLFFKKMLHFKNYLTITLIILLCAVNTKQYHDSDINCCNDDNVIVDNICSNGEPMTLKCEHGKFRLDPIVSAADEFVITDSGEMHQPIDDSIYSKGE